LRPNLQQQQQQGKTKSDETVEAARINSQTTCSGHPGSAGTCRHPGSAGTCGQTLAGDLQQRQQHAVTSNNLLTTVTTLSPVPSMQHHRHFVTAAVVSKAAASNRHARHTTYTIASFLLGSQGPHRKQAKKPYALLIAWQAHPPGRIR
jgi:hypothetical protein